jgi:hypothetical protein
MPDIIVVRTHSDVVVCNLMRVHHQTTLEIVGDDVSDVEIQHEIEDEHSACVGGIFQG